MHVRSLWIWRQHTEESLVLCNEKIGSIAIESSANCQPTCIALNISFVFIFSFEIKN